MRPPTALTSLVWNRTQRRPRAWARLAALVALLAAFGVVINVDVDGAASPSIILLNAGVYAVSAAIIARLVGRRSLLSFGLHINKKWLAEYVFALLVSAALVTFIFAIQYAFGWITITDTLPRSPSRFLDWTPWGLLFIINVLCNAIFAIAAEYFFRGFIYRNVAEGLTYWLSPTHAILLSAGTQLGIVFGFNAFLNGEATSVLFGFVGTLIHGFALIGIAYTGQLGLSAGFRTGWNTTLSVIFGFSTTGLSLTTALFELEQTGPTAVTGGAFGPEGGLIGVFAALVAIFSVFGYLRYTDQIELDTDSIAAPKLLHNSD